MRVLMKVGWQHSTTPTTFCEACSSQRGDMPTSVPEIEAGNFATSRWVLFPPKSINVACWNINRGLQLERIIKFLALTKADILLLQEADLNARRTHYLHIAREIAQNLQ